MTPNLSACVKALLASDDPARPHGLYPAASLLICTQMISWTSGSRATFNRLSRAILERTSESRGQSGWSSSSVARKTSSSSFR
jgi:hypothetical protein